MNYFVEAHVASLPAATHARSCDIFNGLSCDCHLS